MAEENPPPARPFLPEVPLRRPEAREGSGFRGGGVVVVVSTWFAFVLLIPESEEFEFPAAPSRGLRGLSVSL